jgi:hypothetical protein
VGGFIHGLLATFFPPQPEEISELRIGARALVRGRVVPRDMIDSPLTGERCVYYQYTVEQWRQSNLVGVGGDGFWQLRDSDEAIVEFYIQDDTGRAIVAPQSAQVERAKGVELGEVDVQVYGRRAQQLILGPGDFVEIAGVVAQANDLFDEGRDYRGSPARTVLTAPSGERLIIRLLEYARKPGSLSE